MPDCMVTVSGLCACWLVYKCTTSSHILTNKSFKVALYILMKGLSFNSTEDNLLCDHLKAWRKRVEMLTNKHGTEEGAPSILLSFIKTWSGELGQTHIGSVGLTGDNATSTKHILDSFEGHCKPRNNETVVATAEKQLVQGDCGQPE